MNKKKVLAILTLVCFLFTLIPVTAFAATDGEVDAPEAVLTNGGNSETPTPSAIGYALDASEGIYYGKQEGQTKDVALDLDGSDLKNPPANIISAEVYFLQYNQKLIFNKNGKLAYYSDAIKPITELTEFGICKQSVTVVDGKMTGTVTATIYDTVSAAVIVAHAEEGSYICGYEGSSGKGDNAIHAWAINDTTFNTQDGSWDKLVDLAVTVTTEAELKVAVENGCVITLGDDIELTSGLTIEKDVTIYGNGHTIRRADNYTGTLITVTAGKFVMDGVTLDGGAVWRPGADVTPANRENKGIKAVGTEGGHGQLLVLKDGTTILQNGTILQNNDRCTNDDPVGDEGSAIYVNGGNLTMDSTTTIKDNAVQRASDTDSCGDGAAVSIEGNSTVVISGEVTGNYAERMGGAIRVFQTATAKVTLKDLSVTGNYCMTAHGAVQVAGAVTVSGKVVITDNYTTGNVPANLSANDGGRLVNAGLSQGSEIGVYTTGFGADAIVMTDANAADASLFKHDNNDMEIVYEDGKVKVANITVVTTLDELKTAIAKGGKVKLGADITGAVEVPEGVMVEIDLNGYKITNAQAVITNKGNLTISDSSEPSKGAIESTTYEAICNAVEATNLTINGGTIKGAGYAICDYGVNSINTLNGGKLVCDDRRNLHGGMGYVIGSYGDKKGGAWVINDGVTMENAMENGFQDWVNTGANGEATENTDVVLVNANRTEYVNNNDGTYTVNVKSYDEYSLNEELEDIAESGAVARIALIDDVTGPITVPTGAKVVLDLNGHEITGGINNYGDLTIEDSEGTGEIVSANPGIGVCNFNKLTVNAGTIEGMGYEGISNMNTAVSLDINGGTVSGGGYAVCDYGVNSINTVTGGTLISKARGVGNGIGYVIGSYGNSKGGTWVITSGVAMENKNADDKWVNTDKDGQASAAAQVALANAGAVNFAKNEDGTVTTTEEGSLKETVLANVKAQAEALKAAIDAASGLTDVEKTAMKANVDAMVSKVETEIASGNVADIALAASKAAAVSEVLEKALEAYEAIAKMTDDTRKAELKAEVTTVVDAATGASGTILTATTIDDVATAKTDAITAIELALVEAKADTAQNLTSGDKAEIDAALDAVESGNKVSEDKGVAKVENILNKADIVSDINDMNGLTADDKAKLVDVAETAKETAATNIGNANDANAVALAAAKADANYEAIAAVADAYAYINSQNLSTSAKNAAKALLDAALTEAQTDINGAGNVAEIGHALQELMTKIDGIKADNTRGWSSSGGFSGVYNYPVTAPQVDNCVVTVSDSSAVAGETVTVTTKPDGGYGVAEVIVTDKNGNEIEVTALGNGQFTFVMPAGGVDVSVVCKPAITMVIDSLYINIFGKIVKNDVAPKIVDGRTVLPIRVVAEALGADVDWDPTAQKVTITKGDTVIELFIGKYIAFVDGEAVQLDVAPFIDNNRTYLPLRFVSEYLGAIVNWDAETRTVTIVPGE